MTKKLTWVEFYGIIVGHCEAMDDALKEIRDYPDVLLFSSSERAAYIATFNNRSDPTHITLMAEVYRTFEKRISPPSAGEIKAIADSLFAHGCIEDEDNIDLFRCALELDNAQQDNRKNSPAPLFSSVTIHENGKRVDQHDEVNSPAPIISGVAANSVQYSFGVHRNPDQKQFGATKPSTYSLKRK